METHSSLTFCLLFLALPLTQIALSSPVQKPVFPAIFAFGDSLTDTGNYLISKNDSVAQIENHLPYGITFFHKPTGRFSDGRLVVDFLAERLRAPLLKPSLSLPRIHSGPPVFEDRFVNFAVAGATAQNAAFLQKSQNIRSATPYSLDVQLKWFKHFMGGDMAVHLPKALIYFAEIGGNDFNYAFMSGKAYAEVLNSVLNVTAQIKKSLQKLIKGGAKYIVVEGNMPMGCLPFYIQIFRLLPKDSLGCVELINELSHKHNMLLRQVTSQLIVKYPDVSIVYFDVEKAYIQVLERPSAFGFTNTTGACYDVSKFANSSVPFNLTSFQELKACPYPSKYLSWDGLHLTEAMYKALTNLLFDKGFVDPYPNILTKG